jgi:ribose transport system ATP-binding protein
LIERFDVRPPLPDVMIRDLSGGNQQKVMLAKWFGCEPRVAVLHEPTQAVDVGARSDILRNIQALAAQGAGVIVSTLDANEIVAVCTRVLILREGRIIAELPADDPHAIVHAVYGGDPTE